MKIIEYNVDGYNLDIDSLVTFLKEQDADVVCLNELCTMYKNNGEEFHKFRKKVGYEYGEIHDGVTDKKIKHPIGILSKIKFETKKYTAEKMFWHVFKEFYFAELDMSIFVTHLIPSHYKKRKVEATMLINVIRKCQSKYIILTGDLNTLSLHEREVYEKQKDEIILKDKDRNKFSCIEGNIKYDVTKIFGDVLFDAFHRQAKKTQHFNYSVPTKKNRDAAHFMKMLLDYFYVNNNLVEYIEECKTIYEGADYISDHYPVCLTIKDQISGNISNQIYDLYKPKTSTKTVLKDIKSKKVLIKFNGHLSEQYLNTNIEYHKYSPVCPKMLSYSKKENTITLSYESNAKHLTEIKQLVDNHVLKDIALNLKKLHNTKPNSLEYVNYNTLFNQMMYDMRDNDYIKKIKSIDPDFKKLNGQGKLIHGDLWLNNILIAGKKMFFVDGGSFNLKTKSSLGNPYIDIAHLIAIGLLRKAYYYKVSEDKKLNKKQIYEIIKTLLSTYFNDTIIDDHKLRLAMALSFISKVVNYENIFHGNNYENNWTKLKVLCEKIAIISLEAQSSKEILDVFFKRICVSENEKKINLVGGNVHDVMLNVEKGYVEKDYKNNRDGFIRDLFYHLYAPTAPKIKDIGKTTFYQEYLEKYVVVSADECTHNFDLLKIIASKIKTIHQKNILDYLIKEWKEKTILEKYNLRELYDKDPLDYSYKDTYKTLIKRADNKLLTPIFKDTNFDIISNQSDYRLIHGDIWPGNILLNEAGKMYLIDGEAILVKNHFSVGHPYVDITLFIVVTLIFKPMQRHILIGDKIDIGKIEKAITSFISSYDKNIDKEQFQVAFIITMLNKLSDMTCSIKKNKFTEDHLFVYQILMSNIKLLTKQDYMQYIKKSFALFNKNV